MYFKKTSTIAFQLFRYWTKKASKKYPNYDFVIIDERKLVSDLENSIESALNSLTKEEKAKTEPLMDTIMATLWVLSVAILMDIGYTNTSQSELLSIKNSML